MREADAQLVLLVRAVEEVDGEGELLSAHDRAAASTHAHAANDGTAQDAAPGGATADATSEPGGATADAAPALASRDEAEAFLARRARDLAERLGDRLPSQAVILRSTRLGSTLVPTVVVVALLVGLFSNALGPERRINVLSVPLVAILAWNLLVYLAIVALWLRPRAPRADERAGRHGHDASRGRTNARGAAARPTAAGREGGRGAPRVTRLVEWFLERAWVAPARRRMRSAPVLSAALARYLTLWRSAGGVLVALRVEHMLHLGALALAAGAVGGMYLRGLAFSYQATWESTFLGPAQVTAFLRVVLGPALAVVGRPLPDVAALQAPAAASAAEWIHLWALTTALVVIAPRALLAAIAARRARSRAADVRIDLSAGYFRRLLAPRSGARSRVIVRPYSCHPTSREQDVLAAMLHDLFGARADVAFAAPLAYGDELDGPAGGSGAPDAAGDAADGAVGDAHRCEVLLFALAQSPETEVHGELLARLRERAGPGRQVLVLVDGSGFRARLGAGERLDERRRAWDRVARDAGLAAVHVDLRRPAPDDELAALGAALSPPEREGAP